MSLDLSWWLLALIVGGSAPLWVRALANRWEQRARRRTERILAQLDREPNPSLKAEQDANDT